MKSYENIIHFCGITTKNQSDNSKKYLLVMEYANDSTLQNYLKEHLDKLTWNNKLNLALQLARVVCLYDEGITHHLNSNNVLVHQGIIKLSDFGLSKRIEGSFNLPSTTSRSYSLVFDQIRYNYYQLQTYTLNKRSDIYSIGILLWELTSGHPPFRETFPNTRRLFKNLKIYTECWDNEPDNRLTTNDVITKLNTIISNQLSSEYQIIQKF
ncbi:unnamed protein product [Rhizophagus irregularis]|nr:unnamed protein product [Rhizophagus irregularis]